MSVNVMVVLKFTWPDQIRDYPDFSAENKHICIGLVKKLPQNTRGTGFISDAE